MKKSDVAMIVLIASMSVIIAYFIANAIIGDVKNEAVKVKTTDPITADIEEPDKTIFNSNAINPTVEVIIGGEQAQESQ